MDKGNDNQHGLAVEPSVNDEAVYEDVRSTIADARSKILVAANSAMVEAY